MLYGHQRLANLRASRQNYAENMSLDSLCMLGFQVGSFNRYISPWFQCWLKLSFNERQPGPESLSSQQQLHHQVCQVAKVLS